MRSTTHCRLEHLLLLANNIVQHILVATSPVHTWTLTVIASLGVLHLLEPEAVDHLSTLPATFSWPDIWSFCAHRPLLKAKLRVGVDVHVLGTMHNP